MSVKYSFVVPIYQDGYLVNSFCEEIELALQQILGTERIHDLAEVIFVNDGSRDNSQELLVAASARFPFVKVIELSRNFGQHVAVSCGYRFAVGEYICMINADQQDPPNQIGVVLDVIAKGGCDIVVGLRSQRGESLLNSITSRAFNSTLNLLTGAKTPLNAASLRIMTRQFIDAYNSLGDRTPYIPGLENWLGFRHSYVPILHQRRRQGKSSYNFGKRWRMALESVIGFSDLPLRIAATLGFLITVIGMLLAALLGLEQIVSFRFLPGFTSTIAVIVFLGGLNLMFLGLVSLYVGRILREVQGRPRFVVRSFENFVFHTEAQDSAPIAETSSGLLQTRRT
jgi:glycosyltransferase involved in cell wall biosynthesis